MAGGDRGLAKSKKLACRTDVIIIIIIIIIIFHFSGESSGGNNCKASVECNSCKKREVA